MKAFLTGVTGQDGFYLSKFLLDKGYKVYGLVRRSAQSKEIPEGITVVEGDVTDPRIVDVISDISPNEIYHLAAMSHVGESFKIPTTTFDINAKGTLNVLEAAKRINAKFYQASTSELFGISPAPQSEKTSFHPRSPYGVSKLAAYWLTVNYREAYNLFACNGILFNHESPLRGENFVTQKIAKGVAKIFHGETEKITLGNLDAKRDWGHAEDFVRGMWLMLQHSKPDDYVLATGETCSIRDFLTFAFEVIGIYDWKPYVVTDPKFLRPSEVPELRGDYSKAKEILGWEPERTVRQLAQEMVLAAISAYRRDFDTREAQENLGSWYLEWGSSGTHDVRRRSG